METVFVVLNYYELPHYYLNVFGGFSICFIITLYLQSYIFQFCNQLFILHKDSVPTLEIGKVTNVSVPIPKYGNPGIYNQEMIVDITAEINGTSASFQKLPAMGDIADFGNNIVVSCNKEAMNSEVSSMKQRSLDIINSIETHQSIIKGCDEILSQLNPEIVEKQRQEQENKALREEINSLKEMFREFIKTSLKQEQHGNNN